MKSKNFNDGPVLTHLYL